MFEDCQKFLKIIKNVEPYVVKFEKDGSMITKNNQDNQVVGNNIC